MSQSSIELIKERLSIIDVISMYTELHKAGKNFKAKSPFTNEKTPSFYVSPDRGVYYCFSSQKGGDMFTFIQEMEGVDFKGALKILADKAGVELVPEDPRKRDERDTQYALLEEATVYFFHSREENIAVQSYITDRGVDGKTIHTWRVGYAKDEWRALRTHLKEKGFTDIQMLRAGLIKNADQGKEPYDVFRDRIMFPIFDTSGRVVAFSGRTLKKEANVPKYVNSPETELFQKSDILYGYDKAKSGIRHYDFSLLVEGQFDLVLSHQAGYSNAVAVSGTAFTEHHLTLLSRLSNRTVLALDSDRAGIAAVKRVGGMMLKEGMDVKVAEMPFGKDPADVVRQDPQALKQAVGASVHVIEFLLKILRINAKDDRAYTLCVREEILPLLAFMPNRMDREHFEHLTADATKTTPDAVHFEVERILEKSGITHVKVDTAVKETQLPSKRKDSLIVHLTAVTRVLHPEDAWIGDVILEHLRSFLGDSFDTLLLDYESRVNAESFGIETTLETMKKKDLIRDIEEKLTELAHIIARERLATLRESMDQAEIGTENASLFAAQTLLRTNISLGGGYTQEETGV